VAAAGLLARLSPNLRLDADQTFAEDLAGLYELQVSRTPPFCRAEMSTRSFPADARCVPQPCPANKEQRPRPPPLTPQVLPALEAAASPGVVRAVLAALFHEPSGVAFSELRAAARAPGAAPPPDCVLLCLVADLQVGEGLQWLQRPRPPLRTNRKSLTPY